MSKEDLEKKVEKEEVTEAEFEDVLLEQMSIYKKRLDNLTRTYNQSVRIYNKFLLDKKRYIMKYFKQGINYFYVATKKNKIGFKYGKKHNI